MSRYSRVNHFREFLHLYQGKEIPEDVFIRLKEEIRKDRVKDLVELTYNRIKTYLKKLRLTKYYEHIPYIRSKIIGQPAPSVYPRDRAEVNPHV